MAKQQGKKTKPVETEVEEQVQDVSTPVNEETTNEVVENTETVDEKNNEAPTEEVSNEINESPEQEVSEANGSEETEAEETEVTEENKDVADTEEVNEADTGECQTEDPSNKNDDMLSNERLLEIAEQINNDGKSLNDINEITTETEKALKEKVANLEELEKELKKDIEKNEAAIKWENNTNAQKLFRHGFSEFWNGVSDGWNN